MNLAQFWGGAAAPFEIEQSLRFDGTGRLSRSMGAGSRTTATISCWIKSDFYRSFFIDAAGGSSNSLETSIYMSTSSIGVGRYDSSWGQVNGDNRDPAAWYHVMWVLDTNNSTGSDRIRVYVNGVRRTFSFSFTPSQGENLGWNNSAPVYIGHRQQIPDSSGDYYWGYLAEMHHVDGTALDPTDFGEFDDNGVWRPIEVSGLTYGTNGFYLKFDPSATNGIGHDHSGNGNNFTPSGFDTTNTTASTYDVMSDTPTNNFCTWNPLDSTGVTLKNGNLDFGYAGANDCGGTFAFSSGKWYWEIEVRDNIGQGGQPLAHGIHNASVTSDFRKQAVWWYTDEISAGVARRYANNSIAADVSIPSSLRAIDIGDYVQCAYDADSGKVWFGVNNTWMDGSGGTSGNPGTGSNPVFTMPDASIPMTPWRSHAGIGWEGFTNFGQRPYQYTPPTGFNSVCTANLPAPTVKDGSKNFNTVLYTGNTSTQSITGVGFQPDFLWVKDRTNANSHALYNVISGAGTRLSTNLTAAEITDSTTHTSFDADGFSLGSDGGGIINRSGRNYVAWNWLAANGTSSNTDGSITSTVSANPTAGFSIVSYTGTGANATVGHGLGVGVDFILIKSRSNGSSWQAGHSGAGWTKYGHLDLTNSFVSSSIVWQDTAPTSTVFSLGTETGVNGLDRTYIAYCFAEVEGYSKFGSYVGNGSTDGPFVYCGFRPAFFMVKRTDAAGSSWIIHDTARDTYNKSNKILQPNQSTAEVTNNSLYDVDIISNGIKLRNNSAAWNVSSATYIFAAFAEHPTGGSGVSPATAR